MLVSHRAFFKDPSGPDNIYIYTNRCVNMYICIYIYVCVYMYCNSPRVQVPIQHNEDSGFLNIGSWLYGLGHILVISVLGPSGV